MDSMRGFNSEREDDYALSVEDDDADMETPPAIGTDERRMHVRAYNYWVSLLGGRAYPAIEDLDPESLDDFGPHSVLLDFSLGIENPAIGYLGGRLREECGLGDEARTIADVPPRSLLSRLTDHYLQIIANRAPIGFEAEFISHRGTNTMYRGILMPFSSDDETIDFIYGVINWKELADPEMADELELEMSQALAAPPRRLEPVPVWADGPHADDDEIGAVDLSATSVVLPEFELAEDAQLGDWLAAARETAEVAKSADSRSRAALYRALGQAYDFALAADEHPDDYGELLRDSRIRAQTRAPMTPVVKLVFGADYDKARLTEYAAALMHGRRRAIARGGMVPFLEGFAGGLKAIVKAERAFRAPAKERPPVVDKRQALRARPPRVIIEVEDSGDEEFVVLVARRVSPTGLAVLGPVLGDAALVDRAIARFD